MLRAVAIYLFLVVIFRIAGHRTLAEITTFDLVLLLIVSESTQQGLLGEDFSVTNAFLLITTLVAVDIGLALLKRRFPKVDRALEGGLLVIVEDGRPLHHRMTKARVDTSDVLQSARATQGLERMDQIKYAVLERGGSISIIPRARLTTRADRRPQDAVRLRLICPRPG